MRYISLLHHKTAKPVILLLSLVLISLLTVSQTFAYIITHTDSMVNTFISGVKPNGELTIRKVVEHPFGEGYTIPENLEFTFEIELGEKYKDKDISTTQGKIKANENGVVKVKVKANDHLTIKNLFEGTTVSVTEINQPAGFKIKDGVDTQTTTITSKENAFITFVNTYTPLGADSKALNVTGTKELKGRDWQQGDIFTFNMDYRYVLDKDSKWKELGTKTIEYDKDKKEFNQFDFTESIKDVKFEQAGVYAFKVYEVAGSVAGVTYDETISYFDVLVSDKDMDGKLEIQNVSGSTNVSISKYEDTNIFDVKLNFVNKYAPSGSAELVIPIIKTVDDKTAQNIAPSGFTFELYDDEDKLLKTSDVTLSTGETSIKLIYDSECINQTYNYVLKETNGGKTQNGMTFDDTKYEIEVTVIDNLDGTLSANTDFKEAKFVNTYKPKDATAKISGTKTLKGEKLLDNMFSFKLYTADKNFDNLAEIETTANNVQGKFEFKELTYSSVGTYYYVVAEDVSNPIDRVTYDKSVYGIMVTVADDGSGKLKSEVLITEVGKNKVKEITFTNIYKPKEKPTEPTKPTDSNNNTDTTSPKTSDQSVVFLLIILAFACTLLVVSLVQIKLKKVN